MDKQTESREQFEAWIAFQLGHTIDYVKGQRAATMDRYYNEYIEIPYQAWKASRESIDVDTDSHTILTHTTTAIPPGYKLVPVEPTFQICEILGCKWESGEGFPARWASMLAEANGEVI